MDAIRSKDGAAVTMKRIHPSDHPYEVDIGTYLSSEPLVSDPRNHCVPIYDVIKVPDDGGAVLVVMPMLRRYASPRFDTFGEVIDYFKQVFEVSWQNDCNTLYTHDSRFRVFNLCTSITLPIGMVLSIFDKAAIYT
jgi:hypothetical protein